MFITTPKSIKSEFEQTAVTNNCIHRRSKSYPEELLTLKLMDDLSIEFYEKDLIATGLTSNVYLGRLSGRVLDKVAIKIPHDYTDCLEAVKREFEIIQKLKPHSLILSSYFVGKMERPFSLIFKYADYDVGRYFKTHQPTPFLSLSLIRQLFQQLHTLHSNLVYHGDLKPHNLLLYSNKGRDNEMGLVIADYSQSMYLNRNAIDLENLSVGTTAYTPPESFTTNSNMSSPSSLMKRDIYAAGITSYYITTGRLPFKSSESPVKLIVAIKQGFLECGDNTVPSELYSLNNMFYDEITEFIRLCIQKDPEGRPGACEALELLLKINIAN